MGVELGLDFNQEVNIRHAKNTRLTALYLQFSNTKHMHAHSDIKIQLFTFSQLWNID